MSQGLKAVFAAVFFMLLGAPPLHAGPGTPVCMRDSFEGLEADICFRDGPRAFLKEVPRAQPDLKDVKKADVKAILGKPDYRPPFAKPGSRGAIIAQFQKGAMTGPALLDLYVFEDGLRKAPLVAYVSKDGKAWKSVGCLAGGGAWFNVPGAVALKADWPYIKLAEGGGRAECLPKGLRPAIVAFGGPELDAVGAKVCAAHFRTPAVGGAEPPFFDPDRWNISERQRAVLRPVVSLLGQARAPHLTVTGYEDKGGPPDREKALAARRAASVADYLIQSAGLASDDVSITDERPDDGASPAEGRLEIDIMRSPPPGQTPGGIDCPTL